MANAVEIRNLTVDKGGFRALENVNLTVGQGEFAAILGPNGAGKTTLIKAILGLEKPVSGEISLFGMPRRSLSPKDIGYVAQFKTLDKTFPAVTCDLVASGLARTWPWRIPPQAHIAVSEALSYVSASDLCHKPLKWLSGGELQRVYLARALVRKPRLLLLDEPATGIDPAGEIDMYHVLENYIKEKNAAALIVTHDWLAARHHASKAILLNKNVISVGDPSEALLDEYMRTAFGHEGHYHPAAEGGARDV